jgi:hypothetical protein
VGTVTKHDTGELLVRAIGPACHELRSPLAVVFGFAKMLESNQSLDPTAQRYVEQIVSGSERLDRLLDGLSRMGRVAAGRLTPTIDHVSIAHLLTELGSERIILSLDDDVKVRCDPEWLSDAIADVAAGLCFEEGHQVTVSLSHTPESAQLEFRPATNFPMIDTEPDKANIGIACARIRLVAMGGSLDGDSERLVLTIPRG